MTTQPDAKRREHITLKAVTTTTDQGVFEAVISTEGIDREKDIVSANGMVAALGKWNRPIPLAWNHRTDAADIFGHIDPASVKNVNGEVVATGQVDLTSDVGKEAWRSFKSRAIGFSFGYLIIAATERKGGGLNINELDVFEITATPTPMNNETRVLGTKSVPELQAELQEVKDRLGTLEKALEDQETRRKAEGTAQEPETARAVDPLRKRALDLAREVRQGGVSTQAAPPKPEKHDPQPEMDAALLRRHSRELMLEVLRGVPSE
jgi:HK97 family phage prohead protease